MLIQGGPLLVINGVIAPINGLINGFAWGYNPYKLELCHSTYNMVLGLMLHLGEGIVPSDNLPEKDEVKMCKNGCLLFWGLSRLQNRSIPPEIYPKNPFVCPFRKGLYLKSHSFRMGLEPKTSENRSGGVWILRVSSFRDSQVINHHLHQSFLPETHHIPNYTGWFMTRSRLISGLLYSPYNTCSIIPYIHKQPLLKWFSSCCPRPVAFKQTNGALCSSPQEKQLNKQRWHNCNKHGWSEIPHVQWERAITTIIKPIYVVHVGIYLWYSPKGTQLFPLKIAIFCFQLGYVGLPKGMMNGIICRRLRVILWKTSSSLVWLPLKHDFLRQRKHPLKKFPNFDVSSLKTEFFVHSA